jgi:hypothetical protein
MIDESAQVSLSASIYYLEEFKPKKLKERNNGIYSGVSTSRWMA